MSMTAQSAVDNEQRNPDRDHSDPETSCANASDEHDGSDEHEYHSEPDHRQHGQIISSQRTSVSTQ
jgi:hypothetical protein